MCNHIKQLHDQAMDLAEEAFVAKRKGQAEHSRTLFLQALDLETQATTAFPLDKTSEPTRSILFRSAAALAYHAQDYTLAQNLALNGLQGQPPPEIEHELSILLKEIRSQLHPTRVSGILKVANNLKTDGQYGLIQLLDRESEISVSVHVPAAQMRDVVRAYFDESVVITGYQKGDDTYFEHIERAPV